LEFKAVVIGVWIRPISFGQDVLETGVNVKQCQDWTKSWKHTLRNSNSEIHLCRGD
jgi:hypothetical protein